MTTKEDLLERYGRYYQTYNAPNSTSQDNPTSQSNLDRVRQRVLSQQTSAIPSQDRLEQMKQQILNPPKQTVADIMKKGQIMQQNFQANQYHPTQPTSDLQKTERPIKANIEGEKANLSPYQPLSIDQLRNPQKQPMQPCGGLSTQFSALQLKFDDSALFEYQLVQDAIYLLLGAVTANYIDYDSSNNQIVFKFDEQGHQQQKILLLKVLQNVPHQRSQVESQIIQLANSALFINQYYANVILTNILGSIDSQLQSISESNVSNLVNLEIELAAINLYDTYDNLAKVLHLSPYSLDYSECAMYNTIVNQVYSFFLQNYMLPYLKTGNTCPDLLSINRQRNSTQIQPDLYIFKQTSYLDKVGQSFVIIARNSMLLQDEDILKVGGDMLMNKNSITLFFTEGVGSQMLQQVFMSQFRIEDMHKFCFYIQQVEQLSQKLVLKLFKQNSLLSAINSLNNACMMQKSDLIDLFIEQGYSMLNNYRQNININKLRNLFDYIYKITNNWSSSGSVRYGIDLSELSFIQLIQRVNNLEITPDNEQKVMNMLKLCIVVKNKLVSKLLSSDENMTKYELIFRRLFREKVVETELNKAYKCLLELKSLERANRSLNTRSMFKYVFKLMERMEGFIKQLELNNQIGIMVVIQKLQENIKNSISIDEINCHIVNYLDEVLQVLLLKENETIKIMDRLFADILVYARYIQQHFSFVDDTVDGLTKEGRNQLRLEKIRLFLENLEKQVENNRISIIRLSEEFEKKMDVWKKF